MSTYKFWLMASVYVFPMIPEQKIALCYILPLWSVAFNNYSYNPLTFSYPMLMLNIKLDSISLQEN